MTTFVVVNDSQISTISTSLKCGNVSRNIRLTFGQPWLQLRA
jgi:hypothetical protein